MTVAELIVRALDLAKENYCEEGDLDSEQLRQADRIRELYREYRRHMDLITAARMARVVVVQEILESKLSAPKSERPVNFAAPKVLRPLPENDPTVLGRDSLGRIKRVRNISPELREKKRQLIVNAREAKLKKIREAKSAAEGDRRR